MNVATFDTNKNKKDKNVIRSTVGGAQVSQ